jgi:hypothetical protein
MFLYNLFKIDKNKIKNLLKNIEIVKKTIKS